MSTNLENAPEAVTRIPEDKVSNVDVRPILQAGGEPFSLIMETINKTPDDGAMRLRASFQPTPLFRVLGAQGWSHWVEYGEGDDWMIWFYKPSKSEVSSDTSHSQSATTDLESEYPDIRSRLKTSDSLWTLDVRSMAPPEPMEMTMAVLKKLPTSATLLQINERIPQFLLPLLEENGFRYEVLKEEEGHVEVKIQSA